LGEVHVAVARQLDDLVGDGTLLLERDGVARVEEIDDPPAEYLGAVGAAPEIDKADFLADVVDDLDGDFGEVAEAVVVDDGIADGFDEDAEEGGLGARVETGTVARRTFLDFVGEGAKGGDEGVPVVGEALEDLFEAFAEFAVVGGVTAEVDGDVVAGGVLHLGGFGLGGGEGGDVGSEVGGEDGDRRDFRIDAVGEDVVVDEAADLVASTEEIELAVAVAE
jgi:hypothetical protein